MSANNGGSMKSDALSGLSWGSAIGNDISTLEIEDVKMKFIKYTNVKFGMKSGIGSSNNDNDWCIMRAEEMILIKAEALARIELWGEGFSMADIMRLGKPVVRFQGSDKGNWPDAFCFNIAADDPWLLLRIPQKESNNNAGIVNNTGGNLPVAGQNPNLKDGATD